MGRERSDVYHILFLLFPEHDSHENTVSALHHIPTISLMS